MVNQIHSELTIGGGMIDRQKIDPLKAEIDEKWLQKIQATIRSPYLKIDVPARVMRIHALLEDYIDIPVFLKITEIKGYPWLDGSILKYPGNYKPMVEVVKRSGGNRKLKHNISPAYQLGHKEYGGKFMLELAPKFLRYSDEELDQLLDYILFADKKSERAFVKTFAGKGYGKSTSVVHLWPAYFMPRHGKIHDIEAIGRMLERKYMPHIIAKYRWNNKVLKSVLGCFSPRDKSEYYVIINPALDDPVVPGFVIEHLLFHELLHAYYWVQEDKKRQNGVKRKSHCKVFQEAEQTSPHYENFKKWIAANWYDLVHRRQEEWKLFRKNYLKKLRKSVNVFQ